MVDATTRRPIVNAVVEVGSQTLATDTTGRFSTTVKIGTVMLTASAAGYVDASLQIDVVPAGVEVEITLVARPRFAEDVTVTGARAPASPTHEVSPQQVNTIAGTGDNIFRALATLPGVAATGEFDSRLSVRGGGPDQNLTMMDGVEIYNPYRLFGLTSAFNPETVQRFELGTGGFSARYGDRLSSILLIDNRTGTRAAPLRGSATLGLTDANVVTEGRVPGTASASWLVTARRTYYDLIAEQIVDTDLPSFGDLQTTVAWEPKPGRQLRVFGLISREGANAALDGDTSGERFGLQSQTRNALGAVAFSSPLGTRFTTRTIVSWYRNRESFDVDAAFRNESRRSNRADDDAIGLGTLAFTRSVAVRDVAVRHETAMTADRHVIATGFETHAIRTDWAWRITGDRNPHESNPSSMFGGSALPARLDSAATARRAGAWVIDRWPLGPRVATESGLRVDWSGLAGEVLVSPRFALTAAVGAAQLRAAGGLFTQSPGYEKLLQSDYFVDLTNAGGGRLRSERAWHALVGAERPVSRGVVARAETYYKRFDRLIGGKLETPDETMARAATYDFPDALRPATLDAPRITTTPSNNRSGRAYGVDLYLAKQKTSSTDRATGWVSYTLGKAETIAYGRSLPFDYDRRHALSVVAAYAVRPTLDLAATLRVQSGFPYTPAIGVRPAAVADLEDVDGDGNVRELVPQRDRSGLLVWETDMGDVTNLNAARLPTFARLDVRVTFRPRWSDGRWQFYVDVINVLNRANAGSIEPDLEYDPQSDRPRVISSRGNALPFLPSLGLRYRF
ncbi:MAG TPA: TonB-dependent receptor plug domain-containing protein [Vicinamibacterales bacterium]|nr:TonB-dependent receptor plug domain-containing protein [Vicinamibacterales bacterium]